MRRVLSVSLLLFSVCTPSLHGDELATARKKSTEELARDFRDDPGCAPFLSPAGLALLERGGEGARVFVDSLFDRSQAQQVALRSIHRFGGAAVKPLLDKLRGWEDSEDDQPLWKILPALREIGIEASQAYPLVLELLTHPNDVVRTQATFALQSFGPAPRNLRPRLVDLLSIRGPGLTDPSLVVDMGRDAIPLLVRRLESSQEDPEVEEAILQTLNQFEGDLTPVGPALLRTCLRSTKEAFLATHLLSRTRLDSPELSKQFVETFEGFVRTLEEDASARIAEKKLLRLVRALNGKAEHPATMTDAFRRYQSHANPAVRRSARLGLVRTRGQSVERKTESLKILEKDARNQSEPTTHRRWCVKEFARLAAPAATSELIADLWSEDKGIDRRFLTEHYGHAGPAGSSGIPSIVEFFVTETDDDEDEPELLPYLSKTLTSLDPTWRQPLRLLIEEVAKGRYAPALVKTFALEFADRSVISRALAQEIQVGSPARQRAAWKLSYKYLEALKRRLSDDFSLGQTLVEQHSGAEVLVGEMSRRLFHPEVSSLERQQAIWVLCGFKGLDPKIVPRVIEEVKQKKKTKGSGLRLGFDTTSAAVPALHLLGALGADAKSAVVPLYQILRSKETSLDLAEETTRALGKIGPSSEAAVPLLCEKLNELASQPKLRGAQGQLFQQSLLSLQEIGVRSERVTTTLIALATNPKLSSYSRIQALETLGELQIVEALPVLVDLVRADREITCRPRRTANRSLAMRALQVLSKYGPLAEPATPALLDAARGDSKKRDAAIEALNAIEVDDPAAIPILATALWEYKPSTSLAMRCLARFGPKAAPAVEALRYYIRSAHRIDRKVLAETCRTLAAIGPAANAAVPELRSLVRNEYQIPYLRKDTPDAQMVRAAAKAALESVESDR